MRTGHGQVQAEVGPSATMQRYHLDDIVAAHEAVEAGTNRKVMLDIA